jgi:hypothetical protein
MGQSHGTVPRSRGDGFVIPVRGVADGGSSTCSYGVFTLLLAMLLPGRVGLATIAPRRWGVSAPPRSGGGDPAGAARDRRWRT